MMYGYSRAVALGPPSCRGASVLTGIIDQRDRGCQTRPEFTAVGNECSNLIFVDLRGERLGVANTPANTSTTDGPSLASDLRPQEISSSSATMHLLVAGTADVCFLVPCSRSPKFERHDCSLITETHNSATCGTTALGSRDTFDQTGVRSIWN